MNKVLKRKITRYITIFFCKLAARIYRRITVYHDHSEGFVIAYCPGISVLVNPSIEIIETVGLKKNYRYKNNDLRKVCEKNENKNFPNHNVYWESVKGVSLPEYLSKFLHEHKI